MKKKSADLEKGKKMDDANEDSHVLLLVNDIKYGVREETVDPHSTQTYRNSSEKKKDAGENKLDIASMMMNE